MGNLDSSIKDVVVAGLRALSHVVFRPIRRAARSAKAYPAINPVTRVNDGPAARPVHSALMAGSSNQRLSAANSHRFNPPGKASAQINRLRVLRVVDASCSAHSAGRMVISGRFSDVCAELDRMSRQEAA